MIINQNGDTSFVLKAEDFQKLTGKDIFAKDVKERMVLSLIYLTKVGKYIKCLVNKQTLFDVK